MILNNVKLSRGIFILLIFTCVYGGAFVDRVSAEVIYSATGDDTKDMAYGAQYIDFPAGTEISKITLKVHVPPVAFEDPANVSGEFTIGLDMTSAWVPSNDSYFLEHDGTDQYMDLSFTFPAGTVTDGDGLDFIWIEGTFYEMYMYGSTIDTFTDGYFTDDEGYIPETMVDIYMIIEDSVVPAGPPPFVPLSFKFIATSSDLLASVGGSIGDGVRQTGQSIWPLFVFLGIPIAFIIALQVVVFTKRTVGGNAGGVPKSGPYGPGGEHHKAFKRGRKLNKEDGIDLFPDN